MPALLRQRAPKGHSAVGTRNWVLPVRPGSARVLDPQLRPMEGASRSCPEFSGRHHPSELANQFTNPPLVLPRQLGELGDSLVAVRAEGAASRPAATGCLKLPACVRFPIHLIHYPLRPKRPCERSWLALTDRAPPQPAKAGLVGTEPHLWKVRN